MSVLTPAPPAPPPASPAPAPEDAPRRRAGGAGRQRTGKGSALVAAEVSLLGLTVTAVAGLWRLFADGTFFVPVAAFALLAHGLAVLCRRRGMGGRTTAALAGAGLVLAVAWLLLPATTAYGMPTTATLGEALRRLSSAWTMFHEVSAPAPVEPGFVLASVAAVWLGAFLADTAAFRTGAVVEAVVPAATLFVFGAALGAPWHRGLSTAFFLLALLSYWLAQRALASAATPTWLAGDQRSGVDTLARAGARLALVGIVGGLLLGPLVPGAGARALIPWRSADRTSDDRVTISPLVDIRTRMVDQADVEVFTVRSPERSYWRLTSLESFDGRIWSSKGSYRPADGRLDSGVPAESATSVTVTQEFQIRALASIWLPAAFRPLSVEGVDARYDAASNSLLTNDETSDGLTYTVDSQLSTLTAAELASVSGEVPAEIASVHTLLPPSFPERVTALARQVTAGAQTPYETALRLQDHFRENFQYSLDVPEGHSDDALETFLFDTRTGYCEQFAGAFAAMARAVGLPTRVAVGFTPGEPTVDGSYQVRGSNGHAWPEVFLAGYGWVPFEPTPGRGIPSGEAYTGVPEQQAPPGDPGTGTTTSTATATTLAPGAVPSTSVDPRRPGFEEEGTLGTFVEAPSPWPRRAMVGAGMAVAASLLWAIGLAIASAVRRRRRRTGAASPAARVLVAWTEVGESLRQLGVPPRPSETPTEYARRASLEVDLSPRLLRAMAAAATVAEYAPVGMDDGLARSAERAARVVEDTVVARLEPRERLVRLLDPRPLLRQHGSRRHINEAPARA